ncbi:MAG: AraC family transcriptional regulator [Vicinamibacterales bacterium]
MTETDAGWAGTEFVERLQVACGALTSKGPRADVHTGLRRAIRSVAWQHMSGADFVVARGVLLSFLVTLTGRSTFPARVAALPLLARVGSASGTDLPPVALQVLRCVLGESAQWRPRQDRRVQQALTLVESHSAQALRLDDLARQVGVSRWHLERLIKQGTGLCLRVHLARARVRSALELLRRPAVSVKEVSAIVGYGNPDSFRRDFKRLQGMTPHAWVEAQPPALTPRS